MNVYTTIGKKVKEFDVLISDDPEVWHDAGFSDDKLQFKNLYRVYCNIGTHWATFVMSKQMLKDESMADDFIHRTLTRQFDKLKETKYYIDSDGVKVTVRKDGSEFIDKSDMPA